MVVRQKTLKPNPKLTQIADALDLLRLLFGASERRQQQRRQDCDDAYDDQQFQKRKGARLSRLACGT